METNRQQCEEILNKIVSARNRIATGNKKSALEILAEAQTDLHNYQGNDRAYILLLAAYGEAVKCANSAFSHVDIKASLDFKEFQRYLGLAVELIQPEGMTKLPEEGDDLSATRTY
ncbi:hypothetical protein KY306_02605 [Candidatus Woesearchaeota archaeon]|nr:hypothetical protein [Candidatus Woesearchaeota archaeon]